MTQELNNQGALVPDMKEVEVAHIAGVIDAIGAITAHVSKNDRYRIGYQFEPMIRVYRSDNGENDVILGKLMSYAEEEGARYNIVENKSGDSPSYQFTVNDPESIQNFLEPLMPFLTTKFEAAELMAGVIAPSVEDGKHREKETFIALMEVLEDLRSVSPSTRETKYDADYFRDEWDIGPEKVGQSA